MSMSVRQQKWRGAAESSLLDLVARFKSGGSAVEVNFRQLVSSDGGTSKSAHAIHPYPAKLIVNIPQFFLAALPTVAGSALLDPFCGSGTVLYEGALAGLRAIGSDSNPLARLITRAKLTPLDREVARRQLDEVMAAYPSASPTIPDVVNRDYWFSARISDCLGRLKTAIERGVPAPHRPVFDVSFSATVRRVSYADPRLSVPVKINPDRSARYGAKGDEVIRRLGRLAKIDVGAVFWSIANQNIQRCPELGQGFAVDQPEIFSDARSLGLAEASVGLAITSPPYVGAQKYVRASSLSLGWLGLTPHCKLRPIEQQSIGRGPQLLRDASLVRTRERPVRDGIGARRNHRAETGATLGHQCDAMPAGYEGAGARLRALPHLRGRPTRRTHRFPFQRGLLAQDRDRFGACLALSRRALINPSAF
jgi:hypothetical protein